MYNKSKQWKTWRPQWIYPTERPLFIKKLWVSSYLLFFPLFLFFILTGTSFNAWALAQQLILTKRRKEYRTSDFLCTFFELFFLYFRDTWFYEPLQVQGESRRRRQIIMCVYMCVRLCMCTCQFYLTHRSTNTSVFSFFTFHTVFWSTAQNTHTLKSLTDHKK